MSLEPNEDELAEFLRDFGANLIQIGCSVPGVNWAVRYVRAAADRREPFGDALLTVWKMHREGKLAPKEAE